MKASQFTPSRIKLVSCNRTYNCSKANDHLGYTPIVSLQVGIKRTIEWYPHLKAEVQLQKDGPSKASSFLGSGKVADTLLWRDKKQTLLVLLVLATIYFIFIASRYTIITAASRLLLVASIFQFICGKLPEKIFGYRIEKIPKSKFHISEEGLHHFALSVASVWNSSVNEFKSVCQGHDWILFLKVFFSLLAVNIVGAFSLRSLFVIGVPFVFVSFIIYEKMEEEIDGFVLHILSFGCKLKSKIAGNIPNSKKQQ